MANAASPLRTKLPAPIIFATAAPVLDDVEEEDDVVEDEVPFGLPVTVAVVVVTPVPFLHWEVLGFAAVEEKTISAHWSH